MKNLFLACVLLAQAMSSAAAAKSVQHPSWNLLLITIGVLIRFLFGD